MNAILAFVGATTPTTTPWWTIVPASISAMLTAGALWVTYRLFRRGSTDREREQANLVYAVQTVTSRSPGKLQLDVTVHNRSNQPIWEVDVNPLRAGTLQLINEQQRFPAILPETDYTFELTLRPDGAGQSLDRTPSVTFVDYAGQHWEKVGAVLKRQRGRRIRRHLPTMINGLVARDRNSRHAA